MKKENTQVYKNIQIFCNKIDLNSEVREIAFNIFSKFIELCQTNDLHQKEDENTAILAVIYLSCKLKAIHVSQRKIGSIIDKSDAQIREKYNKVCEILGIDQKYLK